jgi:hypothetical protein
MIIYLAGGFTQLNDKQAELVVARDYLQKHPLYPRLVSYRPYSEKMIESVLNLTNHPDIADKVKIMFDSGAWWAKEHNESIDIDKYIGFVNLNKKRINHYFNLDEIGVGKISRENYVYMKSAGLSPIPVYHTNTSIQNLKFYMEQTDYIAIGAMKQWTTPATRRTLDYLFGNYFTDSAGWPRIKVHALGLCSVSILRGQTKSQTALPR